MVWPRTDSFGPTAILGLGVVFAEALEDATHRLEPFTVSEARVVLSELDGATLLTGFRDRPPVDMDALATAVVAVGDLIVDQTELPRRDLTPRLAGRVGVVALDVRDVLDA